MNKTDKRILKQFYLGKTLDRIARLIGRPGDIERVLDALRRAEISEKEWYKNEKE